MIALSLELRSQPSQLVKPPASKSKRSQAIASLQPGRSNFCP
ncbi:MAG: hypothetical protein WBL95_12745 [Microcoleus sp.]